MRVRVAYRGEVAQVDAVDVQPLPPRGRVGQRGEARGGVDGEARGGEHRRSAAEQLDGHLVSVGVKVRVRVRVGLTVRVRVRVSAE